MRLIARLEIAFEAESVQDGGRRLKELTDSARNVGFSVTRARVEEAAEEGDASERSKPLTYLPADDLKEI